MALAAWHSTITDDKGNVLPNAQVYVVNEASGGVPSLYSDRNGTVGMSNPFHADADGFARFHVIGGAYRITARSGGYERTWRYVGIGTSQETDIGEFGSGEAGWDAVEQTPAGLANHTGAAIGFRVLVVNAADNRSAIYEKTGAGASWTDPIFVTGSQGAPGAANELVIGSVAEGPAGATITGSVPQQVLNLSIPKGDDGEAGPPNSLSIGTVASGGTAGATITGTAPAQTLNLTLPKGDIGSAATIAVGATTTGAAGSNASVANVGTSGAAVLNFTIPRGNTGASGTIIGATASALAAGASPTVLLGGTPEARTFAFGIPKGDTGDKGDKGDTGDTGDTGPANTLSIGTVGSGASAGATITGTSPSQTLNLVLPKGDKGDTGDTGPSGTITGATASGLAAGAAPTVALGGTPQARTFAFGIPKGDKGEKGDNGDKGDKGDTGAAATIAAGTTATGAAGTTASVTNAGTSGAAIFNFTIPRGDKGETGNKGDKGETGNAGPANSLSIGSVTNGTSAGATITGTSPSQTLNLVLPKGDKGDTGDQGIQGNPGPANSLSIGTVSSGPTADATITGTAPSQTLSLILPKGDQGDQGIPGSAGSEGWTPVFAIVTDGARSVQQVVDWVGGTGTKPATGEYVGSSGFTSDISLAVNIRGAAGAGTGDMQAATYDPTNVAGDAFLRGNHHGTQDMSTVSGLTAALSGKFNNPTGTVSEYLDGTGSPRLFPSIPAGTVTSVGLSAPTGFTVSGSPVTSSGSLTFAYAAGYEAYTTVEATKLAAIAPGATANTGTVTSVGVSVPTGLSVAGSPITGAGTFAVTYAAGYQGYTSAEASKLAGIAAGAQVNTVTSVAGKTGAVTLAKGDVGLGSVDNTSDANKPVSTAQAAAINAKVTKAGDTGLGGFTSAGHNLGNLTGTVTPVPTATSNFKYAGNNGAFTLAAPTTLGYYTIAILVTNAASGAGAMTATGFSKVHGTFAADANKKQVLTIEVFGSDKILTIREAN